MKSIFIKVSTCFMILLVFATIVFVINGLFLKKSSHADDSYNRKPYSDVFQGASPNFRINGISDEDKVLGIPDAYQIIALNVSLLGNETDTKIEGLSQEVYDKSASCPDGIPDIWRVGITSIKGDAPSGHISIVVDDANYIDPIKKHLYLGLDEQQINQVEVNRFLDFIIASEGKKTQDYIDTYNAIVHPDSDALVSFEDLVGNGRLIYLDTTTGNLVVKRAPLPSSRENNKAEKMVQSYYENYLNLITVEESDQASLSFATLKVNNQTTKQPRSGSRTADKEPHLGAALVSSGDYLCTSGPSVRGIATDNVYSSIAAHCDEANSEWASGGYFYGKLTHKKDFPEFDSALLKDSVYTDEIWTNSLSVINYGDNFTTRHITGMNNGTVGTVYCVSGAKTLAVCNAKMTAINVSADIKEQDSGKIYTANHLSMYESTNGAKICQHGDSGAPVYTRNTSEARANFKGWLSACDNSGTVMLAAMATPNLSHLESDIFVSDSSPNGRSTISDSGYPDISSSVIKFGELEVDNNAEAQPKFENNKSEFNVVDAKTLTSLKNSEPWKFLGVDSDGNIKAEVESYFKQNAIVFETDDYVILGFDHGDVKDHEFTYARSCLANGIVHLKKPLGNRKLYHIKL